MRAVLFAGALWAVAALEEEPGRRQPQPEIPGLAAPDLDRPEPKPLGEPDPLGSARPPGRDGQEPDAQRQDDEGLNRTVARANWTKLGAAPTSSGAVVAEADRTELGAAPALNGTSSEANWTRLGAASSWNGTVAETDRARPGASSTLNGTAAEANWTNPGAASAPNGTGAGANWTTLGAASTGASGGHQPELQGLAEHDLGQLDSKPRRGRDAPGQDDHKPDKPKLEGKGAKGTVAEANWTELGRSIKIYVYDLPADASMHVSEEERNHNYYFEVVFPKLLRMSATHRVFDPEQADFFYVPVEAASYWYMCKTKGCGNMWAGPRDADDAVVSFLRSVGPYWSERQDRHIVPSLRCPVWPGHGPRMRPTFPQLWDGRALQLCLQASRELVDERRALHVGYYVPDMSRSQPLPMDSHGRNLLAVYMGAPINRYRMAVSYWMQNLCKDCAVFELQDHSNASEDLLKNYHSTLRRARFAIEPPGDTLERMSRDASVLAGAIPVVFDYPEGIGFPLQYLPWSPVVDWSTFSVNFTLTPSEVVGTQDFVPRLEQMLRGLVASGEADRLYAGITAAQPHLRWSEEGTVATLAAMLAQQRAAAAQRCEERKKHLLPWQRHAKGEDC